MLEHLVHLKLGFIQQQILDGLSHSDSVHVEFLNAFLADGLQLQPEVLFFILVSVLSQVLVFEIEKFAIFFHDDALEIS